MLVKCNDGKFYRDPSFSCLKSLIKAVDDVMYLFYPKEVEWPAARNKAPSGVKIRRIDGEKIYNTEIIGGKLWRLCPGFPIEFVECPTPPESTDHSGVLTSIPESIGEPVWRPRSELSAIRRKAAQRERNVQRRGKTRPSRKAND